MYIKYQNNPPIDTKEYQNITSRPLGNRKKTVLTKPDMINPMMMLRWHIIEEKSTKIKCSEQKQ